MKYVCITWRLINEFLLYCEGANENHIPHIRISRAIHDFLFASFMKRLFSVFSPIWRIQAHSSPIISENANKTGHYFSDWIRTKSLVGDCELDGSYQFAITFPFTFNLIVMESQYLPLQPKCVATQKARNVYL